MVPHTLRDAEREIRLDMQTHGRVLRLEQVGGRERWERTGRVSSAWRSCSNGLSSSGGISSERSMSASEAVDTGMESSVRPGSAAARWSFRELKGLTDFALALVLSSLLLPVMALVALAVKLTSRGPVFYVQDRVGGAGVSSPCSSSGRWCATPRSTPARVGAARGPRVTSVGRFLRRYTWMSSRSS